MNKGFFSQLVKFPITLFVLLFPLSLAGANDATDLGKIADQAGELINSAVVGKGTSSVVSEAYQDIKRQLKYNDLFSGSSSHAPTEYEMRVLEEKNKEEKARKDYEQQLAKFNRKNKSPEFRVAPSRVEFLLTQISQTAERENLSSEIETALENMTEEERSRLMTVVYSIMMERYLPW